MKNYSFVVITFVAIIWLAGCSQGKADTTDKRNYRKLGIIGEDTDVWDNVKDRLKRRTLIWNT